MRHNGHRNYNAWNTSLWLMNNEYLYSLVMDCVRRFNRDYAAVVILSQLKDHGITHTPDGVRYCVTNIRLAIVGL